MNRRSLEELKAEAIRLAQRLGKTPSRKELSDVIKESEWAYYGMTVTDFQQYCGLLPNKSGLDNKTSEQDLLKSLAQLCLRERRIPHQALLRKWIRDGKYHSHTLEARFGGMLGVQRALFDYATTSEYGNEISLLPGWKIELSELAEELTEAGSHGYVYMNQHGSRREYKIGKTKSPIRREGELRTQLPEQLIPIHKIETDDPSGVEAYWHNRFREKQKNGEWFVLSAADILAFKRWKKIY